MKITNRLFDRSRWGRTALVGVVVLGLLVWFGRGTRPAEAANGCGGNGYCGTIRYNAGKCTFLNGTCTIGYYPASWTCQTVTQDECRGVAPTVGCRSNKCRLITKRISCCTKAGGGGGGATCPPGYWKKCEWTCKKRCTGPDQGSCTKGNGTRGSWCHECNCVRASCVATAPSNLGAETLSQTKAKISWTPGVNGSKQKLYLDATAAKVEANCTSGCLVLEQNLAADATSYTTADVLTANTIYYYKVATYEDSACAEPSASSYFNHSFLVNAWWQVQGGNVHAQGGLLSDIPQSCADDATCKAFLIREDANGQAGAVSFQGSLNLGDVGASNISENSQDWQLETVFAEKATNYKYFYRIASEDPNGLGSYDGSEPTSSGVWLASGDITTSGGDWTIPSGVSVVLLVPGEVVIDNNIDVAEGGFLAIISSGSITIADDVTRVEGVYIADGTINTCASSSCGTSAGTGDVSGQQLIGEGIFVGWSGIDLRRDFASADNNTNPAELFIYRPDLQTNAYRYLLKPHYTWREVAP